MAKPRYSSNLVISYKAARAIKKYKKSLGIIKVIGLLFTMFTHIVRWGGGGGGGGGYK